VSTYSEYEERLDFIDDQRAARIIKDICTEAARHNAYYVEQIEQLKKRVAQLESERDFETVAANALLEKYRKSQEDK